jgi:hypothetical protein
MYKVPPSTQPNSLSKSCISDAIILLSTFGHFLIALYFGFVVYQNTVNGWGWASNRFDYKRDIFLILLISTVNLLISIRLQRLKRRKFVIILICLFCVLLYLFSKRYTL